MTIQMASVLAARGIERRFSAFGASLREREW